MPLADRIRILDEQAIENFKEYLQIKSVHPEINYDECINFLMKQAASLGLPITVVHVAPQKPVAILTWIGTDPDLPSVVLNSHMDVVPVFEEKWSYKPFSAHVDEEGRIFGRGAQDMKSVGVQYLEAIRYLKVLLNVRLRRTVHVTFVPDEEIGSIEGMGKFVETSEFKGLNVGFWLDEGEATAGDEFSVYYGEKCVWQPQIHCSGQPGHGSRLVDNTAGEKAANLLNKVYQFRREVQELLKDNPEMTARDVMTINLTQISGGIQANVIPSEIVLVLDCRLPVTVDPNKFEVTLNEWCQEAGPDVTLKYVQKQPQWPVTRLDESNPYWTAFKTAIDSLSLKLNPVICPGFTDARYVRKMGIPALGFSPMNNTISRAHDNDEYLSVETFLKGIQIYCKIITGVGNVAGEK